MEVAKDLVAGSIGGAAGIVAGQPLDVAKVRQQMASPACPEAKLNVGGVIMHVVRQEGPFALWKGVVAPVASQGAFTALSFAGFNATLAALKGLQGNESNAEADPSRGKTNNLLHLFLAGSVGGALTTLVTTPCELVKLHLQIDLQRQSTTNSTGGVRRIIAQRIQSGGLGALYTGWAITLLRDTPTTGLYFLVYYRLKDLLLQNNVSSTPAELFSGGAAGVISWGSVIPVDIVKTRVQTDSQGQYRGALHCAKTIYWREGVKGFFKGGVPLLLRAFPVNAITFFAYERVYQFLSL